MVTIKFKKHLRLYFIHVFLLGALTACGGGESNTADLGSVASVISSAGEVEAAEPVVVDENDTSNTEPAAVLPLEATISSNKTSGEAELQVQFTADDASGNTITAYQWNFGDGRTASGQVVSHTFTSSGSYKVRVTLSDEYGQTGKETVTINISEPAVVPPVVVSPAPAVAPVASMSASPVSGEVNLNVRFSASDSGSSQSSIASYAWDFGDGATGSGANVSHTYTSAGNYTAYATLTNADGLTSRAMQQITVNEAAAPASPVASMSANPSRGETTLIVTFSAADTSNSSSPVASYQWNFGDGSSGTGRSTTHSYTRAGTYTALVAITNEDGQSANTSRQITVTDPVVLAPPVASINASPDRGEATLQVNFSGLDTSNSGSAITEYQWNFGDGDTASAASVLHSYTTAGTYTATLSMRNNNGLTATATQQIVVTEATPDPVVLPVAVITASPSSGSASLAVSFNASNDSAANISSYAWDFGDGNSASGSSVTHNYDAPNTYIATLTLTTSDGEVDSTTHNIYVFGNAIDNSQAIVPNSVYFYDDFNYSVQRSGDNLTQFQAHGWNGGKAENLPAGSGKGYIYTTTNIPGYSGPFPGKDSTSVLALEGRPSTFGIQTDFYLQFGGDFDDQVPADVWFQYWMYTNDYDDPTDQNDQMSRFGPHPKFIYPTKGGFPSNNGLWILYSSNNSKAPYSNDLGQNSEEFYFYLADMEDISYLQSNGSTTWKIGQTDISDHMVPNRWTLVKIHIDTSTVNPRYEQWMKPMGGQWLKVAEQIQGQTPNLNWTIAPGDVGGHRAFRMPTTQNGCRPDASLSCDSWMYLDDFTIATSEDTLPVYPY